MSSPTMNGGGSSPLARGLPYADTRTVRKVRIIPARAGFTTPGRSGNSTAWDHPRSRGVYVCRTSDRCRGGGSSPLARGLLTGASRTSPRSPDHPRSRGVYTGFSITTSSWRGSSPLARGLRTPGTHVILASGIIPARAGFTLADPWNPNEPTLYQTPAAFTADLGPAPPGRDSAVEFGAALSAAGRAGRDLAAAGLRSRFGHHPDMHRRVATTSG